MLHKFSASDNNRMLKFDQTGLEYGGAETNRGVLNSWLI